MLRPTTVVLVLLAATPSWAEGNNDKRDSGIHMSGTGSSLSGTDASKINDLNHNGVKDVDTDGNGLFDHIWSGLEHAWDTVSGYFGEYHSYPEPARSDYDCICVRGDIYIPPHNGDTTPRA